MILQRLGTPLGKFCLWKQVVQFACHCFKGLLSPLLSVSGLSGVNIICPLQLFLDFFLFSHWAFLFFFSMMRVNSVLLITLQGLRLS